MSGINQSIIFLEFVKFTGIIAFLFFVFSFYVSFLFVSDVPWPRILLGNSLVCPPQPAPLGAPRAGPRTRGGGRRPVARSWETAAVVAGDGGPVRGPRPPWGAWAGVSAPKQTDFFLFSVSRTWVSGRPCCLPGRVPGWRRAAPRAAALGLLPRALGGHETWGMVLEPSVSAESDHAWPSPSSLTAGTRGPQPFHCLT